MSRDGRAGQRVRSANDVEAVEFEGRLVLIGPRRGALVVLNETARIVWETMRAGVGAEEMAALLAQGYGVPLAEARADVAAVLEQWRTQGLLEPAPAAEQGALLPGRDGAPAALPRNGASVRPEPGVEHVYDLCGTAFRLRFFDRGDIGAWMHQLLAHAETPDGDAGHVLDLVRDGADHVLVHNGRERQRHPSVEAAVGSIVRAICDLSYPDADWSLFMHAAAVARGDHAVVLVGPNGSGKSTLTAALIASGLDYLSDDVVPLDGRAMRAVPLPFAISAKEGSWPVLSDLHPALRTLPIQDFGGRRLRYLPPPRAEQSLSRTGAAVRTLVFPRFEPGRPAALTPLPPLEVLARLADSRCLMSLERKCLGRTLDWIRTVPAYALTHGDLDRGADIILRLLDS